MAFQVIAIDVDVSTRRPVCLIICLDGTRLQYTYYVADGLAEELIIGADMMQRWKISLDLENESVSIDPRALYLRI